MKEPLIDNIEIIAKFELEDEKTCKLLYEALVLESSYNPNERAQASLKTERNVLVLKVNAKDSISARAAINSFMKWIKLSQQITSLTIKKDK